MTGTASQTADQIVEVEVRELVRRRGLDPGNGDATAVRQLIDEVVADYAERRLVANMPPLADAGQVAKAVADRVIGMGPLQPFFEDPEVEEILDQRTGQGVRGQGDSQAISPQRPSRTSRWGADLHQAQTEGMATAGPPHPRTR